MNTLPVVLVLGGLATVAAVILLYMFVLPENKRKELPEIGQKVADFFNFKELYIEKVLRFFYILLTVACIVMGASMLLGISHYDSFYRSYTTWYGGYGLLLMILGPIVVRLSFEAAMLFILLVKNVMQINNKLKASEETPEAAPAAPTEE